MTQGWLASIGFSSSNDRLLLGIVKQVGMTDAAGKPTARWEMFRSGNRRALAEGIRQGYPALYNLYPDAHARSQQEQESVIKSSAPQLGKEAVSRAVTTFRTLCSLADFGEEDNSVLEPARQGQVSQDPSKSSSAPVAGLWGPGAELALNLNFQLTLPESKDPSVYEALFAAMRKHLLSFSHGGRGE